MEIIRREGAIGIDTTARARVGVRIALATPSSARLAALERAGTSERALVDELLALRARLRDGDARSKAPAASWKPPPSSRRRSPRERRAALMEQLKEVQARTERAAGRNPLILPTVDYQAVAAVVGDWTGIPVGRMARTRWRPSSISPAP
jgi:type VI secretion system protein VasG